MINPIDLLDPYNSLFGYVRGKLDRPDRYEKDDLVLSSLQEGFKYEPDWSSFFRKIVEDRADAPSWDKLDKLPRERASWLVHQLFRKLASPGRVYRFWRQTEEFFQGRLQDFCEICSSDPNRWRVRRLKLKPDLSTSSGWEKHETYSARWRDAPLELLYDKEEFLTICNLARLLGPEETKDVLKDEDLKLRDEKDMNDL